MAVLKKNGKLRIYIDFQKLYAATKKDLYPLPFMDEILDKVGRTWSLFIFGWFFQLPSIQIAPKDRYKTTFIMN